MTTASQEHKLLNWLVLSLLCHSLSLPIVAVCARGILVPKSAFGLGAMVLSTIVLLPAVYGLIATRNTRGGWVYRSLQRIGFKPIHPTPTGWDWAFADRLPLGDGVRALEIELTDGTRVRGEFSSKSMASTEAENLDLFLETEYGIGKNGSWTKVEHTDGIYIPSGQIKAVRFFHIAREEKGDGT